LAIYDSEIGGELAKPASNTIQYPGSITSILTEEGSNCKAPFPNHENLVPELPSRQAYRSSTNEEPISLKIPIVTALRASADFNNDGSNQYQDHAPRGVLW
jgi:hypothetical protein